jgi:BirA family biotin operon repressor/biotin-[acetyl-CoA-carboxylase] ligase
VLLDGRKIAGVLVEGRPQETWAVLGIGVNLALDADAPAGAGVLGRPPGAVEAVLAELLDLLERRLAQPAPDALAALRARDALRDRPVRWDGGEGTGAGLDDAGRLLVRDGGGAVIALDAGEVHLGVA